MVAKRGRGVTCAVGHVVAKRGCGVWGVGCGVS